MGRADEAAAVAQQGEQHHGSTTELAIHGNQQEGAWTQVSTTRLIGLLGEELHAIVTGRWAGTVKMQAAAVLTETKHEVGIADQPRRSVGRDAKLLRKYPNVYRWPQEGRVAKEGIQGARSQYQRLLGVAPLQRVVGVLCRDGEECLAIAGVVALCRPEVDRPRDVFFMGVAGVTCQSLYLIMDTVSRQTCAPDASPAG